MKVITWNVNGIRAREAQVGALLAEEKPDVLCLQELKAPAEKIPASLVELPEFWCLWHGVGAYSGVSLHLAKSAFPDEPVFSHPPFDHETRIVTARCGKRVFASVYVPNGGKDFEAKMRFLAAMAEWVEAARTVGDELLLCGDLNVARTDRDVHPKERKPNAIGQLPGERIALEKVLSSGVVDVGRALDPENPGLFTWWPPWRNLRLKNQGWRLDYVLASESLFARVTGSRVLASFGTSDHGPVAATFG